MNITLLAINSKYIHSSLALWYLTAACEPCGTLSPLEHSMNEPLFHILQSVYETNPDILVISCYIWNIDYVPVSYTHLDVYKRQMHHILAILPIVKKISARCASLRF